MRYNKIVEDDIDFFKDENEFNNFDYLATNIVLDEEYKGYIDYAGDVDIYSVRLKEGEYKLKIESEKPILIELYCEDGNILKMNVDKLNEAVFNIQESKMVKIKIYSKDLVYKFKYSLKLMNI
ncbi:hypothetical protein [Thermobrachium celere]|uniref:hypothetical protein n=1 Tax=Thermobrachium celere TaxID=53422 RepID=UPI001943531F|nr:hypothetical protein [Thermobrachium celere]GFR34868.1 hypothetical protein TCEA9_06800 [Thermobrachium celere]